jgi:hypothetical protein
MRLSIFLAISIIGTLGSWIGAGLDNGNMFGVWGVIFGTIGCLFGVWAGYKIGKYLGL